jgi:hypothetical protein
MSSVKTQQDQHGGWSEPTPLFDTAHSPVSANRGYEILNLNGWSWYAGI